jgi:hypothetical protein
MTLSFFPRATRRSAGANAVDYDSASVQFSHCELDRGQLRTHGLKPFNFSASAPAIIRILSYGY